MQLIIIGGGTSINEGIYTGLKQRLEGKFTCGINYAYKYFDTTFLACMNYTDFYDTNRKELKELPLIITPDRPFPSIWEKNTVLLKENYALSGILALDVAIKILSKKDEIYLLGYDYGTITDIKDSQERKISHFYQSGIEHRGIGKTSYYEHSGHNYRDFSEFIDSKCRIYNVSPDSNVNCFEKIDYSSFFEKLDNKIYNQDNVRTIIKEKLNDL